MKANTPLRRFFATLALAVLACPAPGVARESTTSLDILVYGASGKVGVYIVDEALQRGHHVTAVSREPAGITRKDPQLSVVKGNILDAQSVAGLVAGRDVVIISVRGVIGDSKQSARAVALLGLEKVVEALRAEGDDAARLIHVGGSGSLEVAPGKLYADTLPKAFIPWKLEVEIAAQVTALDYLRTVTDVDWSYATPAKNFTNGRRSGEYRIGADQVLKDKYGRSRISRADFAAALLDEAEHPAHSRQRFSVAY